MPKQFKFQLCDDVIQAYYLDTADSADRAASQLLASRSPCFGLDIETRPAPPYDKTALTKAHPKAGLDPHLSEISLIQVCDNLNNCYIFDTLLTPACDKLKTFLSERRCIAHYAQFDAAHIRRHLGIKVNIDCSMLMYNLVQCAKFGSNDEEEAHLRLTHVPDSQDDFTPEVLTWLGGQERYGSSLRAVVAKLLGVAVDKTLQTSEWGRRPLTTEQLMYAAQDVIFCRRVGSILSKEIVELGLSRVYQLNRRAIHTVGSMMLNGSLLDKEKHAANCAQWTKDIDTCMAAALRHTGVDLNLNSPKQLHDWLVTAMPAHELADWPRSEKTGLYSCSAKALHGKGHIAFVQDFCDYKKLHTILKNFGESLLDKISPATGRVHGSYTLGYTETGRLSARDPNNQNIPSKGVYGDALRSIFIAPEGKALVGADYSQIELRVAALLSGDAAMLHAYEQELDLHRYLASVLLRKPMDQVTEVERSTMKALNFGLLYGLGWRGLINYAMWTYKVKLTEEEAKRYYYSFFEVWAQYAEWQKKQRKAAEESLMTSTVYGKARKLTEKQVFTCSVNNPVQGTAAELILDAANNIAEHLIEKGCGRLLNIVHDEVVVESTDQHPDTIMQAAIIIRDDMNKAFKDVFGDRAAKKLVDVQAGHSWLELKKGKALDIPVL